MCIHLCTPIQRSRHFNSHPVSRCPALFASPFPFSRILPTNPQWNFFSPKKLCAPLLSSPSLCPEGGTGSSRSGKHLIKSGGRRGCWEWLSQRVPRGPGHPCIAVSVGTAPWRWLYCLRGPRQAIWEWDYFGKLKAWNFGRGGHLHRWSEMKAKLSPSRKIDFRQNQLLYLKDLRLGPWSVC